MSSSPLSSFCRHHRVLIALISNMCVDLFSKWTLDTHRIYDLYMYRILLSKSVTIRRRCRFFLLSFSFTFSLAVAFIHLEESRAYTYHHYFITNDNPFRNWNKTSSLFCMCVVCTRWMVNSIPSEEEEEGKIVVIHSIHIHNICRRTTHSVHKCLCFFFSSLYFPYMWWKQKDIHMSLWLLSIINRYRWNEMKSVHHTHRY